MKRTLPLTLVSAALALSACARHYDFAELPDNLYDPAVDIEAPVAPGSAGPLNAYDFQMAQRHRAVLFDTAKHQLTPAHIELLDALVAEIETLNEYEVSVVGHADSFGSEADNESLSQRRAESVVAYLVSRSIPMARIAVAAHSERKPAVAGDSDWRHAKNRRVDVLVTPTR